MQDVENEDAGGAALNAGRPFVALFGLTDVRKFPESFRGAFARGVDAPICNYSRSALSTRAIAAAKSFDASPGLRRSPVTRTLARLTWPQLPANNSCCPLVCPCQRVAEATFMSSFGGDEKTPTPTSPRRRPRASTRAGEAEHERARRRARGLGVVGAPAGPKGRGRRPAGASSDCRSCWGGDGCRWAPHVEGRRRRRTRTRTRTPNADGTSGTQDAGRRRRTQDAGRSSGAFLTASGAQCLVDSNNVAVWFAHGGAGVGLVGMRQRRR